MYALPSFSIYLESLNKDLSFISQEILDMFDGDVCDINEINNGYCGYWALLANKKFPKSTLYHIYDRWDEDEYREAGASGHVFIKIDDKFYDAKHPTGTSIENINDKWSQAVEVTPEDIDDDWGMSL